MVLDDGVVQTAEAKSICSHTVHSKKEMQKNTNTPHLFFFSIIHYRIPNQKMLHSHLRRVLSNKIIPHKHAH